MPIPNEQSPMPEESSACTKFITSSKKIPRTLKIYIPAQAKAGAMAGGGAFNADYFARLFFNTKNGLDHPAGIVVGTFLVVGVIGANYVMRFRNMIRMQNTKDYHAIVHESVSEDNNCDECTCVPRYRVQDAGWLKPSKENNHPVCYVSIQVSSFLYMLFGAGSGILNGYALIGILPGIIPGVEFNAKCETNQSSTYVLVPAFLFGLTLAHANALSFSYYNLERIRSYYHTFIFHRKFKEIKLSTILYSLAGTLNTTVSGFFATRAMLELLQEKLLCHTGASEIPYALNETLLYLSALSNFIITSVMTIPAMHYRKNNNGVADVEQQLNKLPNFKRFHRVIWFSLLIDTLNVLLGAFLSTYMIKKTILHEDPELDFSPTGIILFITAIIMSLGIAAPNQYALNQESYRKELIESEKDLLIETFQQNSRNNYTTPLLDEENPPEEEKSISYLTQNNASLFKPSCSANASTPYLLESGESHSIKIEEVTESIENIPAPKMQ